MGCRRLLQILESIAIICMALSVVYVSAFLTYVYSLVASR